MLEHALDLAVLPFAEAEKEPGIAALLALKLGFDCAVENAVDGDARRSQPVAGNSSTRARPPSLVRRRRPSVVMSRRPTVTTRGSSGGRASKTVRRPSGSRAVVTRPFGL
jgi:hypothetical protein